MYLRRSNAVDLVRSRIVGKICLKFIVQYSSKLSKGNFEIKVSNMKRGRNKIEYVI